MKKEESRSKGKGSKNPFVKQAKKQITIRIGQETLMYFRNLAKETGVPYQKLIDSYLTDCAQSQRKLQMKWS